jgi:hypothetical protein
MLDTTERQRAGDDLRRRDGIGRIHVAPYVRAGEEWTVPENVLRYIWQDMEREHTIASIRGEAIPDEDAWVTFLQSQQIFPVIVYVVLNEGVYAAGACWLSHLGKHNAFAHFTFLKRFWGRTEQLARAVLEYWDGLRRDDGTPLLKCLVGGTPSENRLAVAFARRMGFTVLGAIPWMHDEDAIVVSYRVHPEVSKDGR